MIDFKPYEELSELETEYIIALGDNIKFPPSPIENNETKEILTNCKDGKKLFENFFEDKITKEEFDKIERSLYNKGFITIQDNLEGNINNLSKSGRKKLKDSYRSKFSGGFSMAIRLTTEKERTISGKEVYEYLIRKDINNQYEDVSQKVNKLQENFNNFYSRIIQIITVFIAIFSLIIGNIKVFTIFLKNDAIVKLISVVLISNGTILFGISFLLLMLNMIVLDREIKFKYWLVVFLPIFMVVIGFWMNYIF